MLPMTLKKVSHMHVLRHDPDTNNARVPCLDADAESGNLMLCLKPISADASESSDDHDGPQKQEAYEQAGAQQFERKPAEGQM